MNVINLFHGSVNIIEKPIFGEGKSYNDYGRGFYCTEHIELAKEWACLSGNDGYANHYLFDTSGLSVLNLKPLMRNILPSISLVMKKHVENIGK